jgi:hypothetical protein
VVNLIRERAEQVDVRASFEISPDPKDDPFCLCSEEGNADFIVTLNPKDFPQERLKAKVTSQDNKDKNLYGSREEFSATSWQGDVGLVQKSPVRPRGT